jgi:hypothetical protein
MSRSILFRKRKKRQNQPVRKWVQVRQAPGTGITFTVWVAVDDKYEIQGASQSSSTSTGDKTVSRSTSTQQVKQYWRSKGHSSRDFNLERAIWWKPENPTQDPTLA